jgi:hypothetical protein
MDAGATAGMRAGAGAGPTVDGNVKFNVLRAVDAGGAAAGPDAAAENGDGAAAAAANVAAVTAAAAVVVVVVAAAADDDDDDGGGIDGAATAAAVSGNRSVVRVGSAVLAPPSAAVTPMLKPGAARDAPPSAAGVTAVAKRLAMPDDARGVAEAGATLSAGPTRDGAAGAHGDVTPNVNGGATGAAAVAAVAAVAAATAVTAVAAVAPDATARDEAVTPKLKVVGCGATVEVAVAVTVAWEAAVPARPGAAGAANATLTPNGDAAGTRAVSTVTLLVLETGAKRNGGVIAGCTGRADATPAVPNTNPAAVAPAAPLAPATGNEVVAVMVAGAGVDTGAGTGGGAMVRAENTNGAGVAAAAAAGAGVAPGAAVGDVKGDAAGVSVAPVPAVLALPNVNGAARTAGAANAKPVDTASPSTNPAPAARAAGATAVSPPPPPPPPPPPAVGKAGVGGRLANEKAAAVENGCTRGAATDAPKENCDAAGASVAPVPASPVLVARLALLNANAGVSGGCVDWAGTAPNSKRAACGAGAMLGNANAVVAVGATAAVVVTREAAAPARPVPPGAAGAANAKTLAGATAAVDDDDAAAADDDDDDGGGNDGAATAATVPGNTIAGRVARGVVAPMLKPDAPPSVAGVAPVPKRLAMPDDTGCVLKAGVVSEPKRNGAAGGATPNTNGAAPTRAPEAPEAPAAPVAPKVLAPVAPEAPACDVAATPKLKPVGRGAVLSIASSLRTAWTNENGGGSASAVVAPVAAAAEANVAGGGARDVAALSMNANMMTTTVRTAADTR